MGFLFSTETNEGFTAQKVDLDDAALRAAEAFAIQPVFQARRVDKHNALSSLYFIDTGEARFVLRSADASAASALALQCRVVSDLDVETLRPLKAGADFVVVEGGSAWIAYPYIDGPLFVTDGYGVMDAVRAALNFQAALNAWGGVHEDDVEILHRLDRDPDEWGILASRILKVQEGLSDEARTFVQKFRGDMARITGWSRTAQVGKIGLAHCDLQHANVVVGPHGPAIIDLEDICQDSPSVSAAHAIFKMARHAVFEGMMTVDQARAEIVSPAVGYAQSLGLVEAGPVVKCGALAALRTLGDVHNILTLMGDPETAWVSYDLEKKVQNVFEVDVLFGGAEEAA